MCGVIAGQSMYSNDKLYAVLNVLLKIMLMLPYLHNVWLQDKTLDY